MRNSRGRVELYKYTAPHEIRKMSYGLKGAISARPSGNQEVESIPVRAIAGTGMGGL
ncbi:MAG TPA: hypothetical protein VGO18_07100 [Steroidobacteraceae bacterium]|nr:hypothetical protein [Steroidobacteraceae bacterium]